MRKGRLIAISVVIELVCVLVAAMAFVVPEQRKLNAIRIRTEERLATIDDQLSELGSGLGRLAAASAASRPDFARRFPELVNSCLQQSLQNENPILAMKTAEEMVRKARQLGVPADAPGIADMGLGFLRLVEDPPPPGVKVQVDRTDRMSAPAMELIGELIGYRSGILQDELGEVDNTALDAGAMAKIPKLHPFKALGPASRICGSLRSLGPSQAKLNLLDRGDTVLSQHYQTVLVEGYSVKLDGMDMRNVVFRNSRIEYGGGRLSLDTVYFTNCTFELAPDGKDFANVLLTSAHGVASLVR